MYIARSSAKSDSSTPFHSSSNIPLIVTRKRVTLSTLPCGIPKSVCLLCEMYPSTLTLIHLLPISSQVNCIILPCIPMFSRSLSVFSLLTLSYAFWTSKKIAVVSSFLLNPSRVFDITSIVLFCFLKSNCLSFILFYFSRYQTSLLFVILLNILQNVFVRLRVCSS